MVVSRIVTEVLAAVMVVVIAMEAVVMKEEGTVTVVEVVVGEAMVVSRIVTEVVAAVMVVVMVVTAVEVVEEVAMVVSRVVMEVVATAMVVVMAVTVEVVVAAEEAVDMVVDTAISQVEEREDVIGTDPGLASKLLTEFSAFYEMTDLVAS